MLPFHGLEVSVSQTEDRNPTEKHKFIDSTALFVSLAQTPFVMCSGSILNMYDTHISVREIIYLREYW